ncbi:hypothetical protein IW140_000137 [Coemansia sp. RSA 1813]|nr:hypothetical protein EV178_000058 [Coemansia sp. RSA 1646]KAJ1772302.1 hypothetical protein LPJ74_001567 [Coemansia sp. RSA 1843]KAJ2217493.1 hypothetical protein EV179_000327 [Coemansia sp. RSA 487]KAJ2573495.1 hypothetical protein IW140_000137 [Coemansia sp. RSA 1813]
MSKNLDLALDDIIKAESRNSGRHSRHRGSNRRDSPYTRNNGNDRRPNRGKWSHDLYEGSRSINDRLSGVKSPINSRLGGEGSTPKSSKKDDSGPARGISITGRSRDTSLYDSMRVVWVTDIPRHYDADKIKDLFSDVGRVDNVRMAIDNNDRFIGKAEVIYRIPEDARSAIQRFDGERLYTTDAVGVKTINVTYSSVENADFIDNLKFENTLPAPREIPMQMRLGGVASSTIATMNMMASQPYGGNWQRNPIGSQQHNRWQGNRQHNSNRRQNRPTVEELDAEMDMYMKDGAEGVNGGANTTANPATNSAADHMEEDKPESKTSAAANSN